MGSLHLHHWCVLGPLHLRPPLAPIAFLSGEVPSPDTGKGVGRSPQRGPELQDRTRAHGESVPCLWAAD